MKYDDQIIKDAAKSYYESILRMGSILIGVATFNFIEHNGFWHTSVFSVYFSGIGLLLYILLKKRSLERQSSVKKYMLARNYLHIISDFSTECVRTMTFSILVKAAKDGGIVFDSKSYLNSLGISIIFILFLYLFSLIYYHFIFREKSNAVTNSGGS